MKKYYLFTALAIMVGLNLLYKSGVPGLNKQGPTEAPRSPASGGPPAAPGTNPQTPPKESETRIWLRQEAARVGHTDPKPTDTIEQLRLRASRLSPQDRLELRSVAVSPEQPADERYLAVFVLSETPGQDGVDQLQSISENPIVQNTNDRAYSDELVIRMQALEAAVKKLSTRDAKSFLQGYVSRITDPQLAKHARYLQK